MTADRRCSRSRACKKHFPLAGAGSRPRRPAGLRGRRRQLLRSPRARRSAWSANPAAASRPSASRSCGCIEPTDGRDRCSTAAGSTTCPRRRLRPLRRRMQIIFQDPYGSLNPRMRVRRHRRRAARATSSLGEDERRRRRAGRRAARHGRPARATRWTRYPHEFSGGQRQRIGIARALAVRARADRLRRAGLRARRLGPGAGHQPAAGPAGGARAGVSVHQPRPRRGRAHQPPRRGHVPRQDRRAGADAGRSSPPRCIPTPRRCSRRCRCPIRGRHASASS